MDKIRIGIIGVGQIGKIHLENYAGIDGVEIVAAADANADELQRVCGKFGIPYQDTDYKSLLKRDDIDAVDVCLHTSLHAPVSIEAMRSGKNVYCEKPLAGSYAEGKAMLEAAKESGKKLHMQLSTLYQKETKAAKRLIDANRLGNIYHACSTGYRRRNRPYVDGYGTMAFVKKEISCGGALYDVGVYHIAQMLYLMGLPEIRRVSGKIYQELSMDEERKLRSGYNVEEFALGMVRFEGNKTMEIKEAWAVNLNPFERSYILGSEGGIRLYPFSYHTMTDDMETDATFDLDQHDWRTHQLTSEADVYDSSQHHWIRALQGRVDLMPTAEVALKTTLISECIYLSDQLKREVDVEEITS
jgi:predicted dehydrogenase